MTGTHLHLLVNHIPILGAVFASFLLLASLRYGGEVLQRTALVLLVVVAIAGGIAQWTGDPAEDGIRGMPGVKRAVIRAHDNSADKAFIAAALLGMFSAVTLVRWRSSPVPRGVALTALAGSLVVSGMMVYTGLLGGQIRHSEVRAGATREDAITIEPPRVRRPDSTQMSHQ